MKRLVFFVNIICIASLIIAYLAPIIPPSFWYLPQCFGLIYPQLLIINICFGIIWLFWDRRKFIYCLVALFIGCPYIVRTYNFSLNLVNNNEKTIQVLTYNLRRIYTEDPSSLFKFIDSISADIACYQEYDNKRYQKYQTQHTRNTYPYSHKENIKSEIATFSKYPIINKEVINFNASHSCSGILSDIVVKNDTIRVFNIHLESNKLSVKNKKDLENWDIKDILTNYKDLKYIYSKLKKHSVARSAQSELIKNLINNSIYPTIVCVDLNDIPMSYHYNQARNTLKDSFIEAGNGNGITYREGIINERIDFIFYSANIVKHQVFKVSFSDHYPLKSTLVLE